MAIPQVTVAEANQVYFKATPTVPSFAPPANRLSQEEGAYPSWQNGPTINGVSTRIYSYQPADLLNAPVWVPFQNTINLAYDISHQTHRILGKKPRIAHPTEYLSAIGGGTGDEAFTLVCTAGDQVISSVSAHRYTAPDLTEGELPPMARERVPALEDKNVRMHYWEIKLLAVHPDCQRRRLAGTMLQKAEEEIARRFKLDHETGEELTILLSTIREINYGVYCNKGYVEDYETKKPVGTLKSEKAFTLTHFSKHIQTDT